MPNEVKIVFNEPDAYDYSIKQFVMQAFPAKLCVDKSELVDLLSTELFGTKQTRLGPKPSVEAQVLIRDVIRYYVGQGLPIPFMVPWGSEKPDGSSIDVAELMGLKTFAALQNRVSSHYAPGIQLNIRLEDASAPHLFNERADEAWHEADRYSTAFASLVKILGVDSFIKVKRESYAVSVAEFNVVADTMLPFMEAYLGGLELGNVNPKVVEQIQKMGWKGEIPQETREYYYWTYEKMYPGTSAGFKIEKLARYFSGAWARTQLGIRGDEKEWEGKFIDLSFVQNPPGTDSRFNRRIIYRTIPSEYSSNHMAPWRAKGYLSINENGRACPKLMSYSDDAMSSLTSRIITLTKGDYSVDVRADYITI